jgi:carbamoyltransferase
MLILGINGGERFEDEDLPDAFSRHDGSAVLLQDGEILAGIEEERLNRMKHSNCFPVHAIRYCLEAGNCALSDVDVIATNVSALSADMMAKWMVVTDPAHRIPGDGKSYFAAQFQRVFGMDVRSKLYFCHHHLAHAWSTFAVSGFDKSLILSIDGEGDNSSGMVLVGEGQRLTKLQEFSVPQSLGVLYQILIRIVGYKRFDEYKVMGLAPYGDPAKFRSVFEQCYRLLPNGNYSVGSQADWFAAFDTAGLVAQARRKGDPFLQVHKDFSASLQEMLEKIVMHILQYFQKQTKQRNLCLAGGVAHNCTMNGKILYSGLFEKVFVQPAADDSGGALGAALSAWYERTPKAQAKKLAHMFWGRHAGTNTSIERTLEQWSGFLSWTKEDAISAKTAGLLAEGAVVGWVQGRSEFGPRALGNRSILADPRPSENKLRINEMIKKREQYRPFAPSVLEERIADFFEVPPNQSEFPFMIFILRVREHARQLLGAITHVDGTARVQSVSRSTNPEYWDLISEFEKLTGVAMLLNTSFNNHAEPIVDSVNDAVGCFLTTGIHYLAVGNCLAVKKSPDEIRRAAMSLVPCLPAWRKLVKRSRIDWESEGSGEFFAIESTKNSYFGITLYEISSGMFDVLQGADGLSDFGELISQSGVPCDTADQLVSEFMDLWSQRLVNVSPGLGKPVAHNVVHHPAYM